MPSEDDLVQYAEQEVVKAALAWEEERRRRVQDPSTPASERLRTAVYQLRRARTITGKVRLEEIERAMQEQDKKREPER